MTKQPAPPPTESTVDLIYRWMWAANKELYSEMLDCDVELPDHVWTAVIETVQPSPHELWEAGFFTDDEHAERCDCETATRWTEWDTAGRPAPFHIWQFLKHGNQRRQR